MCELYLSRAGRPTFEAPAHARPSRHLHGGNSPADRRDTPLPNVSRHVVQNDPGAVASVHAIGTSVGKNASSSAMLDRLCVGSRQDDADNRRDAVRDSFDMTLGA